MRVLIIGAGLGGLTLAHGLCKNGIDVKVFERLKGPSDNLTGYGIHINAHGKHALQKCIPLSNWNRFETISTLAGTQMFFRDAGLCLLAEKNDAKIAGVAPEEIERRGIGRLELRDILLEGLNNGEVTRVHWNKIMESFTYLPNGQVQIRFADGTGEEGDVLVGADGAHSAVRQQYLPHIKRIDLGIRTIAGRYVLDDKQRTALPFDLVNGSLNNIVPRGKGWMFVSSWALRLDNGTLETIDRAHHVVWAYVVPVEDNSDSLSSLNPSELQSLVLLGIKDWSSGLKDMVQKSGLSTITCIPLRSMPFLEPWTPSSVTLLGDAIHNMTPMAGVGANTALRDAALLTDILALAVSGEMQLCDAIGAYEEKMRAYANEAVGLSKRNALNASSGHGFQRRMFRMLLRAAQASPFVMRRTIGRAAITNH